MNYKKIISLSSVYPVSNESKKFLSTKSTKFLSIVKQSLYLTNEKKNLFPDINNPSDLKLAIPQIIPNSSNGLTTRKTKPFYTSYSKLSEVKLITLGLAAPERIKQWAEKTLPNGKIFGKVTNANTLHHKTFKPQKGGLFCERIFGPLKDFSCSCGKLNNVTKYKTELKNSLIKMNSTDSNQNDPRTKISLRKFCPDCDVEYTWSVIRRYQLGYIELVSPVTHVWYIKGNPSYLSILLDMKKRHLEYVTYSSETLTLENSLKKNLGVEFGVTPSEIFSSWKKLMDSQQNQSNKSFEFDQIKLNQSSTNLTAKISVASENKLPIQSFFVNSNFESQNKSSLKLLTKKKLKRENEIQKRKQIKPYPKSNWLKFCFSFFSSNNFNECMQENFILQNSSSLNSFFFANKKIKNFTDYIKFVNLYNKWNILKRSFNFEKSLINAQIDLKQNSFSGKLNDTKLKINLNNSPIPFYILFHLDLNQNNPSISFEIVLKQIYKRILTSAIEEKRKILVKLINKNPHINNLFVKQSFELNQLLISLKNEILSIPNKQNFQQFPSNSFFKQLSEITSKKKLMDNIYKILSSEQIQSKVSLNDIQSLESKLTGSAFLEISGFSLSIFNFNIIKNIILQDSLEKVFKHNIIINNLINNYSKQMAKPLIKSQLKLLKNNAIQKQYPELTQFYFQGKLFETKSLKTSEVLKQIISLICAEDKKKISDLSESSSPLEKIKKQVKFEVGSGYEKNQNYFEFLNINSFYNYDKQVVKENDSKLFLITKKLHQHCSTLIESNKISSSANVNEFLDSKFSFFINVNPKFSNLNNSNICFLENVLKTNDLNLSSRNLKFIKLKNSNAEKLKTLYFEKLNENLEKKGLVSNIYTLSHRQRWEAERDWNYFRLFFSPKNNSLDVTIPIYKNRIISSEISIFSNLTKSNSNKKNLMFKQNSSLSQQNLSPAFYSGPGIVSQMLNEFTFSELKKMDSQNRILLYHLNKYVFKLKTQLSRLTFQKRNITSNSSNLFSESTYVSSSRMISQNSSTKLSNSKNLRVLKKELKESYKKRDLLIRRTKLVRKLFRKDSNPQSMILTILPVLPTDLRPIVKIGGQIAASDLNRLYQRVIYRNDRLKKFLNDPATNNSYEMKYAQRLLQEAVDNLISNGKSGVTPEKDSRGRLLKSLSDILKGKQGRFRQYLLGKRVDYSGRSVIVVGPTLKLHECGIPKEMALELYLPFLLKTVLNQNLARTVVGAKTLIKNNPSLTWELLKEIMQTCPVLLNRAPTLHRLGIQAFQPKLIEGRAILLHPLVCSAFNADFDGDQMAVHIPITIEARAEAWKLMLARNNLLSPATGEPLAIPSQDMVLGCYYLTTNCNEKNIKNQKGSGFYFKTFSDVLKSYENKQLDLHSIIWVQWNDWIENGTDHEEPLEIRLDSYGNYKEIYAKSQKQYDSKNRLVTQYVSTTPGKVLFNQMIQTCTN